MIVKNEDVKKVMTEIPRGHQHVRTTVLLKDGTEWTFQEATIANIVRAYIMVKTHPTKQSVILDGKKLNKRKRGYAEWQLLERKCKEKSA
jgi:hypothetical protein